MQQLKTINRQQFNTLAWAVFLILVLFAAALPGIEFPGIGSLYPFRICLPFVVLFLLINDQKYGAYSPIMIKVLLFFAIMLFFGCLTIFWAQEKLTAVKQLIGYIYGFFLVIVLFRLIRTQRSFYKMMMLIAWIMTVILLMGVFEGLTGKYFFAEGWEDLLPYVSRPYIHYPVVCFGNPNDMVFAAFAFMPFINLSLDALYREKHNIFCGCFKLAYFVLYCVVTVLASCRMGILLIPIAVVVNIFLAKRSTFKTFAAFAVFALFMIGLILKWDSVISFFEQDERVKIWMNILRNAEYYLFFGTGPGNSFVPIEGVLYEGRLINPHFWFLEILAEFGFVVFIALLVGYFSLMRAALCNARKAADEKEQNLAKAAFRFLLYFFPMSIMSSSLSVSPFFWLIVAIVLLAVELSGKNLNSGAKHGNVADGDELCRK